MRELTIEELFLVAGAAAAADVDPSEPPTELPPWSLIHLHQNHQHCRQHRQLSNPHHRHKVEEGATMVMFLSRWLLKTESITPLLIASRAGNS